jgi:hypothetical protein
LPAVAHGLGAFDALRQASLKNESLQRKPAKMRALSVTPTTLTGV